jgi:threonine dehydrogenase-like Zn-dependent dehydrogenase
MRAAVWFGFNDTRLVERDVPAPKESEVLIKVKACSGCGMCAACREGKQTACPNYGDISKGHRANGFTAAGTPLFGIDESGGYIVGDNVTVYRPGSIGLMAVQCAKALGAGQIIPTGTREERLELGRRFGAHHTINVRKVDVVKRIRELTGGVRTDLSLVAAGEGYHDGRVREPGCDDPRGMCSRRTRTSMQTMKCTVRASRWPKSRRQQEYQAAHEKGVKRRHHRGEFRSNEKICFVCCTAFST